MKAFISFAMAFLVWFAVFLFSGCGGDSLVVYTAIEEDLVPLYIQNFNKHHPEIKVRVVRDSTGIIIAKLLAEKGNPVADVVWGVAAGGLASCSDGNVFNAYDPAGSDKISPEFKEKNNPPLWVGIQGYMTCVIINKIEMKKMNLPVPASFSDLTDPRYRGRIVAPHPSSSGTGYFTSAGILSLFGEKEGWSYLEKLNENIAYYCHSGSKPAKLVSSGEFPIGITFDYRAVIEKKQGMPVDIIYPSEGCPWDLEANALINKKVIKPESKKFLDWAVSEPAMKMYSSKYGIVSGNKDLRYGIPDLYQTDPWKHITYVDFEIMSKRREYILSEWNKRFSSQVKKRM